MGNNRPIKLKDWIRFLEAHDCKYARTTKHENWKCKGCRRTITFRGQYKEIPALHLKTNLDSMGFDLNYLYNWIDKN